jgi:hypothetical protein
MMIQGNGIGNTITTWVATHHKLYPCVWRNKLREVYTALAVSQPASDYILATVYKEREDMEKAYGNVEEEINVFLKNLFSQAKTMPAMGLGGMDKKYPQWVYLTNMFPTCKDHHSAKSMSFNIENIVHYLRVILFGAYDVPTKDILNLPGFRYLVRSKTGIRS